MVCSIRKAQELNQNALDYLYTVRRMPERNMTENRKEKIRPAGADLNFLENGSSSLNHTSTVGGLNYIGTEGNERKVQSRVGVMTIPLLLIMW